MSEIRIKRGLHAAKLGTAGAAGVALAACAACCAPLLLPLLAWFGLSSLGMATTGWYLETLIESAIAFLSFSLFRHRKAKSHSQSCQFNGSCGCVGSPER